MITTSKSVLTLALFFLLFIFFTLVHAQVEEEIPEKGSPAEKESGSKDGGVMDTLFKALGGAAQESLKEGIDDFIGTYKGRIGDVKFLERRGNSIVLEVKYEGVKRSDGVYVKGEILKWGESLDGFRSTLSSLREKTGSVKITISWQEQDDSGWGVSSEPVTSDQIRLALVRETNPERPFGELVYDFKKTWTDSSEIEEPEETSASESDAGIELAEGEKPEQTKPEISDIKPVKPGTIIKTGTILKPARAVTVKPSASTGTTATQTVAAVATAKIPAIDLNKPGTLYDLYKHANAAKWKTNAGELKFPGTSADKQGFVLTMDNGIICPDNKAKNLLQTHPEWVNGGWIEGRYPVMILGSNFKFRATGAMLKGATNSDGVIMSVGVFHDNRVRRILRKKIDCSAYIRLEADLSEWAGKEVQIVLHVSSGTTSAQDWAVWVNPRLTNQ